VIGFSLDSKTDKDNFVVTNLASKMVDIRGDIRDYARLNSVFETYNPEFVFHLAAQPLVRKSYKFPKETYEVNVLGTINVLEAIRHSPSVKVGIFATTDKVYQNQEKLEGYVETDPLGGYDPYSSSKASAEIAIESWRNSFFSPEKYDEHHKSIASVRAGNVIGGGDWSEDRLIPDLMRSLLNNESINIRNPQAIRPWQHVLDPLNGYLLLGAKMFSQPKEFCQAWNFGPDIRNGIRVIELIEAFHSNPSIINLQINVKESNFHETNVLILNSDKANKELNWVPKLDKKEMISLTRNYYLEANIINFYDVCVSQIKRFNHL
jgi:CDP-glucose 4,6-dehydratase